MHICDEDLKKYIDIYLNNQRMGINFDALFELGKFDLKQKEWLMNYLHNKEQRENKEIHVKVDEMINNYTMHLLLLFFILNSSNDMFSYVRSNFIEEYVKNESEVEEINDDSIHSKAEMKGIEEMYKFIHSSEPNVYKGSYLLCDLHEKLCAFGDNPEFSRSYRNFPAFLPGTGIELESSEYIFMSMREADKQFDELLSEAKNISNCEIEDRITLVDSFLKKLMDYKVELIRIHPFGDGNGRSVRGLINFLLETAGLPPIYVKGSEKIKYREAMYTAIIDGDNTRITNFYKNKLCDSIKELVIDPFEYAIDRYKAIKSDSEKSKQTESNIKRLFYINDNKPKE